MDSLRKVERLHPGRPAGSTVGLRPRKPARGTPRTTPASPCPLVLGLLVLGLAGCGADLYSDSHVERTNAWMDSFRDRPAQQTLQGRASYYHDSLAGNPTANGEIYDPRVLTAASRTLPFGTIVRVVRKDDGRSVFVRINDRGPFGDSRRILDLSREAATRLGMLLKGVVPIRAEIVWSPP